MASLSSEPLAEEMGNSRSQGFKRILRSRWTFLGLQVLDLFTTLYAFHAGALEVNPLVAHLTVFFGRFRGEPRPQRFHVGGQLIQNFFTHGMSPVYRDSNN